MDRERHVRLVVRAVQPLAVPALGELDRHVHHLARRAERKVALEHRLRRSRPRWARSRTSALACLRDARGPSARAARAGAWLSIGPGRASSCAAAPAAEERRRVGSGSTMLRVLAALPAHHVLVLRARGLRVPRDHAEAERERLDGARIAAAGPVVGALAPPGRARRRSRTASAPTRPTCRLRASTASARPAATRASTARWSRSCRGSRACARRRPGPGRRSGRQRRDG